MAIQLNEKYKGFECPEKYIKINSVKVDLEIYKNKDARINGESLGSKSIHIDITEAIYNEVKKLYSDVIDIIDDEWKTINNRIKI